MELKQRFEKEYLGLLVHSKSKRTAPNLRKGEMVLIGSDNKRRFFWNIRHIQLILPGTDGVQRLVRVKTSHGEFLRPIQRLYPLELRDTNVSPVHTSLTPAVLLTHSEKEGVTRTRFGRLARKPSRFSS